MKIKEMIGYLNFIADKNNEEYVLITKNEYRELKLKEFRLKKMKKMLDKLNTI